MSKRIRPLPSFDVVCKLLAYDPNAGLLRWKVTRGPRRAGDEAGHLGRDGYLRVCIEGTNYGAHRVAWLLQHGEWPPDEIDHRDSNKSNNRLSNLRLATSSQNKRNCRISVRNTTGFKGVTRNTPECRRPFKATIYLNGKNRVIGSYYTAEEAHRAYCREAAKHFGDFARAA